MLLVVFLTVILMNPWNQFSPQLFRCQNAAHGPTSGTSSDWCTSFLSEKTGMDYINLHSTKITIRVFTQLAEIKQRKALFINNVSQVHLPEQKNAVRLYFSPTETTGTKVVRSFSLQWKVDCV